MKLSGTFVVRQVMDDTVAVPVGEAALRFNGMIMLNPVSKVIWQCLEQETDVAEILQAVTDRFEVSPQEAHNDILEFVDKLRQLQLLDEGL